MSSKWPTSPPSHPSWHTGEQSRWVLLVSNAAVYEIFALKWTDVIMNTLSSTKVFGIVIVGIVVAGQVTHGVHRVKRVGIQRGGLFDRQPICMR